MDVLKKISRRLLPRVRVFSHDRNVSSRQIKNHAVPFISVGMVLRIEYILMLARRMQFLLFLFLDGVDSVTLALGVAYKA